MSNPVPPPAPLLQRCIDEAVQRGKGLMERLIALAIEELGERSSGSVSMDERRLLADAAQQLNQHRLALINGFPAALQAEIAQAQSGPAVPKPAAAPMSFRDLELMGESQVEDSVEMLRALQAVEMAVDAPLGELNGLISAVQGLQAVRAERNPLRPQVYVQALRKLVRTVDVTPAIQARWVRLMGRSLGRELVGVYKALLALLNAQGVEGVGYTVLPSTQGAGGRARADSPSAGLAGPGNAAAGPPAANVASTDMPSSAVLTLMQLHKLLSGQLDEPETGDPRGQATKAAPTPQYSPTVPAALEALQEMRQLDQVMQRLNQRHHDQQTSQGAGPGSGQARPARQPSKADARTNARTNARTTGQMLALEVINLMVENIANDPRLLPAVQACVWELQPSLLRLALVDPRFFSDKAHPARLLLDRMVQRSLAFESETAPGFPEFLRPLRDAIVLLDECEITNADPFAMVFAQLDAHWREQEQEEKAIREKAVKALMEAEQRNLLAERVAQSFRLRGDAQQAAPEVMRFLCGPWAQAVAKAKLAQPDASADPRGYLGLVPDLLWSTQVALARQQRQRLMRLIPTLVGQLREGLRFIDYPADQTQKCLDELMALHEQGLRTAAPPAEPVSAPTAKTPREQLEAQLEEAGDSEPWLAPAEAQDSGFFVFADTDTQDLPEPSLKALADAPSGATQVLADLTNELSVGAWIDLQVKGRWLRLQLTWASPHGTLFMFTGAHGAAHSMTRRLFDKLYVSQQIRVVAGQALVEGALDAVANRALSNSIGIDLAL